MKNIKKIVILFLFISILFTSGCQVVEPPLDVSEQYYSQALAAVNNNQLLLANYLFWQIPDYKDSMQYLEKISPEIHTVNIDNYLGYIDQKGNFVFLDKYADILKEYDGKIKQIQKKYGDALVKYKNNTIEVLPVFPYLIDKDYTKQEIRDIKEKLSILKLERYKNVKQAYLNSSGIVILKEDLTVDVINHSDGYARTIDGFETILSIFNKESDVIVGLKKDGTIEISEITKGYNNKVQYELAQNEATKNSIMLTYSQDILYCLKRDGTVDCFVLDTWQSADPNFMRTELETVKDVIGIYTEQSMTLQSLNFLICVQKNGQVKYIYDKDQLKNVNYELFDNNAEIQKYDRIKKEVESWQDIVNIVVVSDRVIIGTDKNGNIHKAFIEEDLNQFPLFKDIKSVRVPSIK